MLAHQPRPAMPTYLTRLAEFVSEIRFGDLTDDAVRAAQDVALDTLGAIVAGMREPECAQIAEWASRSAPPPVCAVLGSARRANPMTAALANATAGVALELDEGNRFGGGHPAIHVLPPLLAEAERVGANGADFIAALVAGYEVASRLGGATEPRANVHSHGHWGAPGAAAAIARLRGASAEDVAGVINLAANMSPANTWTAAFEGANARNLYPGRSAMQGVLAADLYDCGFRGTTNAPSDVYGTILGDSFNAESAARGLGDAGAELRIQRNYFKLHACCRYNHASLDALASAMPSGGFDWRDVESVEVSVPWMLEGMLGGYPRNTLSAKFNLRYAVVAALVRGRADASAFFPETIADPLIRAAFDRVRVHVGDEARRAAVENPSARVSLNMRNGETLTGETTAIRGDCDNPIPRAEIADKFMSLASPTLGETGAKRAAALAAKLETVSDMRDAARLFTAG